MGNRGTSNAIGSGQPKSRAKQSGKTENPPGEKKVGWDAKDKERSIRQAEQQRVLSDNLARGQQPYQQLTSEVQDINTQFAAIKIDTEKAYAEQRHQDEWQMAEIRAQASQDEAKHHAEHNQAREQLRAANNGEQEKLHGSAGEALRTKSGLV